METQFCVHTDKRKMLQQLTKDINQHPKKVRVMHELVKSVAAGKCFIQEASTGNVDWLHHGCYVCAVLQ